MNTQNTLSLKVSGRGNCSGREGLGNHAMKHSRKNSEPLLQPTASASGEILATRRASTRKRLLVPSLPVRCLEANKPQKLTDGQFGLECNCKWPQKVPKNLRNHFTSQGTLPTFSERFKTLFSVFEMGVPCEVKLAL